MTIANKILKLYGEGGPDISPSWKLVLDETVRDKVLVNNLTIEDVQTGFTNSHAVDQHIEKAINVTKKEEITKIAPIPSYFIYDGFEKDLYAAIFYDRLMGST